LALLSVQDVTVRFGGILALDGISFDVPEGSVVGMIGPNGAGKTTLFNVVTRVYTPQKGDVLFAGQSIVRARGDSIIRLGISRTFQNVELFQRMTVLDNVLVGMHTEIGGPAYTVGAAFGLPYVRKAERAAERRAREVLDRVGIADLADRKTQKLSGGQTQRVRFAVALVSNPDLLVLDEPTVAMDVEGRHGFWSAMRSFAAGGKTVLFATHYLEEAFVALTGEAVAQ